MQFKNEKNKQDFLIIPFLWPSYIGEPQNYFYFLERYTCDYV